MLLTVKRTPAVVPAVTLVGTTRSVSAPAAAKESALVDLTWTVLNQGPARAAGQWIDSVQLVPVSGSGAAVVLGTFTYDRGLDPGLRYTRTEQLRLPAKIEGAYRIRVVTNSLLGGAGEIGRAHV